MLESESSALPFGDSPPDIKLPTHENSKPYKNYYKKLNWATRIRTLKCWSQSPVPYRLAIAHQILNYPPMKIVNHIKTIIKNLTGLQGFEP